MSNFQSKVTEITIEMDGLHITTVTKPERHPHENLDPNEARIGDFHMSLFTAEEWYDLAAQIGLAIKEVTK